MAETARLESVYALIEYREFESLRHRHLLFLRKNLCFIVLLIPLKIFCIFFSSQVVFTIHYYLMSKLIGMLLIIHQIVHTSNVLLIYYGF